MQVRPRVETKTDTQGPAQAGAAALAIRADTGPWQERSGAEVRRGSQLPVARAGLTPTVALGAPPRAISITRWATSIL